MLNIDMIKQEMRRLIEKSDSFKEKIVSAILQNKMYEESIYFMEIIKQKRKILYAFFILKLSSREDFRINKSDIIVLQEEMRMLPQALLVHDINLLLEIIIHEKVLRFLLSVICEELSRYNSSSFGTLRTLISNWKDC